MSVYAVPAAIGIPSDKRLKCAVAVAEGPTTVVWGSSQAPAGWEVIYSGFSFGSHYTHNNPMDRVCVDNVNFDASVSASSLEALYFATTLHSVTNLQNTYVAGTAVQCAVVVKK